MGNNLVIEEMKNTLQNVINNIDLMKNDGDMINGKLLLRELEKQRKSWYEYFEDDEIDHMQDEELIEVCICDISSSVKSLMNIK